MIRLAFCMVVLLMAIRCESCDAEECDWQAFKVAHKCKLVGKGKGGSGFSSRGSVVWLPNTETWSCDDGLQYTRESQ